MPAAACASSKAATTRFRISTSILRRSSPFSACSERSALPVDDGVDDAAPDLDVEPEQQREPEPVAQVPRPAEPDLRIFGDVKGKAEQRCDGQQGTENADDPAKDNQDTLIAIRSA